MCIYIYIYIYIYHGSVSTAAVDDLYNKTILNYNFFLTSTASEINMIEKMLSIVSPRKRIV